MTETPSNAVVANDLNEKRSLFAKAIDGTASIFGTLSSVLLLICAVIVMIDIVARFMGFPTKWGNDVTVYLLVIFVFLSLAIALKADAHINADILLNFMNARMKRVMKVVGLITTFVFTSVFAYNMVRWAISSYQMQDRSYSFLRMYLWPLKTIMAICLVIFALMALRLIITEAGKVARNVDGVGFGKGLNNPVLIIGLEVVAIAAGCYLLSTDQPILGVVVVLIALLITGTPIAFSILGTAIITLFITFNGMTSVATAPAMAFEFVDKYTVLALPMFIFAGNVMARGGLGEDIFRLASAFLGHIKGGMGIAVIVACTIFGALSGSSVACALTIGSIAYPVMIANGYNKGTAAGLVAIAGGIGILIPPSNSFITYGLVAEVPIGTLFIAGIIPGLLMGLFLSVATIIIVRRQKGVTTSPKNTWAERIQVFKKSIWAILMPIIVLGGIYSGLFTITEAAAVAAVYSTVYSLIGRTLSAQRLRTVLTESTYNVAFLLLIMMASTILSKCITMMRIPDMLLSLFEGTPGWGVILIMMIFCLFLGCFLEGVAITTLTVPIIAPVLLAYNYDLIWYGVLLTVNLTIAAVTPPVGLNLFVMQRIGGLSIGTVVKGAIPFIIVVLIVLFVIAAFPQISLFLPSQMG